MGQSASSDSQPIPWPPTFANGLDSPKYTVIEKNQNYEIREYETSSWMTTSVDGADWKKCSTDMFWKLFKFIGGENEKKMKIAMTAPVLMKVTPGQGPACTSNFAMSFFLSAMDGEPPKPNDETLAPTYLEKTKVYIRSFAGFAKDKDWLREAELLAQALPEGAEYDKEVWYTAGYDSPFRLMNRHNEVWFLAK